MSVGDIVIDLAVCRTEVINMYYIRECIIVIKFTRNIRKLPEHIRMEVNSLLLVENSSIEYLRFDKILRDMTAV